MAQKEEMLKSGWLGKQIKLANKEIAGWPEWKRRGLKVSTEETRESRPSKVKQQPSVKAVSKRE